MSKTVYNLIIVDMSGSMYYIRQQAFDGLNDTILTIRKMQEERPDIEQRISLITFNSLRKRFVYDNVPAAQCRRMRHSEYEPDGGTPLYDAIGMGIAKVDGQRNQGSHVLVTIITDGEENSSSEFTLGMIRILISRLKEQGWTFTLIGTDNLDVESMARSFSIDNHLAFCEDAEETRAMFRKDRMARRNYNSCLREGTEPPKGQYFRQRGRK